MSVFNFQYHWARRTGTARYPGPAEGYPAALSVLRDLADPVRAASRIREYRNFPLWFARDANQNAANRHRVTASQNESRRMVLEWKVGAEGKLLFLPANSFRPAHARYCF